jgi:hypothetical protein
MKECWKEIITKTGNKTIKKMKTHKKDPGNQKRKKPAETAAGSFTQAAPYGGNAAVNYNVTQPL